MYITEIGQGDKLNSKRPNLHIHILLLIDRPQKVSDFVVEQ